MEDTIRIHKKHGLTRSLFEQALNSVEVIPGVGDVIRGFHELRMRTAIISGGFKYSADRIQRQFKITHSFAACEYFFDKGGNIEHCNLLPADYEGKVDFMRLVMSEHKISAQDAVFVGDGKNDVELAKAVGTSIAFNAQPELREVSTYVIKQPENEENFLPVLDILKRI